ncbi:MAG: BMP family ABC transporter substrate-binding protein [Clostridia bacterium]|nr:BMP family ABC transporter substrate-binding protein [Clostridia bacterium]
MKKLLTLLLTAIMAVACCFGLTACGEEEAKPATINMYNQYAYFAENVPDDFKIGFIFLHDEKSTYDLNFYSAAKEAVADMGLTAEQVIYKFNVPEGQECYDAAKELKEAGCKAIFANSFGHGGFMLQAAKDFTDVQFYHATGAQASLNVDADEANNVPANFHNAFASIYEGRFIGGIAAGMKLNEMVKAKETALGRALTADELKAETKIGYVGAYPYAEVKSGYTSFYLGVKAVCPTVTMDVKFTNSWYDEVAEKAAAEALIADGAKLISQHADSMGAPSACEKAGVPNVSYNGTTIADCPNTFIVSSRINWAPYYSMIIASFAEDAEGNLLGEVEVPTDYTGSVQDGMVEILPLNAEVMAKGTLEKIYETLNAFYMVEDSSMVVFNCDNFTVNGQKLTTYKADVVDTGDFQGETEVIKGIPGIYSYFSESTFRSAPYFDIDIDGITSK